MSARSGRRRRISEPVCSRPWTTPRPPPRSRANAIVTLAYDAIRAAVDVQLNASGLKVTGNDQHQLAVEYAHRAMGDLVDGSDLEIYDELRRVRNRIVEYPPIGNFQPPAISDADRYLGGATRIVGAVQHWMDQPKPPR